MPTLKIASNSTLATTKSRWIDCDAGRMIAGRGGEKLINFDQPTDLRWPVPTTSRYLPSETRDSPNPLQ